MCFRGISSDQSDQLSFACGALAYLHQTDAIEVAAMAGDGAAGSKRSADQPCPIDRQFQETRLGRPNRLDWTTFRA